ncbi:MAG: TIGR03960 family B12-binding radical SAM protein [Chloroflexota bacterium]|nr:MAG: TIGR03960 family B12-binding radical SAM protein [Chloroflexota bacterium]
MDARLARILPTVSKPGRYTGGEWNSIVKDWSGSPIRVALAYPEVYEIGMSNLGLSILYDLVNQLDFALAERVFAPWPDMQQAMRGAGLTLYSLESKRPLGEFDVIGFSLGYELTYTNVLNMLDLAGIPVLAAQRDASRPLIIGGGTCCLNPEPMADFFDLFVLGDGEEVLIELLRLCRQAKAAGTGREVLLEQAAQIPGIYVPRFYNVSYAADGRVSRIEPSRPEVSDRIRRRVCAVLPPHVTRPIVPFLETVHDRAAVEIQRGCTRGCRFCQAGNVYRPLRERPLEEVLDIVDQLLRNTGHEQLSLISLSSTDYGRIEELVRAIRERYGDRRLNISLPSLRIDGFSVRLAEMVQTGRKSGFTFAPEAGSQRMRDVIAKGLTEEDILGTARQVMQSGWSHLKLYFMVGLPEETEEDVQEIVFLARKIWRLGRQLVGGRLRMNVSVATFIPKPHTPFQWSGQIRPEGLEVKQSILRDGLRQQGLHLAWHDPQVSLLEAVMSRGDRRLGAAVLQAWRSGCIFDGWSEHFKPELWWQAMQDNGLDVSFYAHRERADNEVLPWSHIDAGVTTAYLRLEREAAHLGAPATDCRHETCNTCGFQRISAECLARAGERARGRPGDGSPAVTTCDESREEETNERS